MTGYAAGSDVCISNSINFVIITLWRLRYKCGDVDGMQQLSQ